MVRPECTVGECPPVIIETGQLIIRLKYFFLVL